MAPNELIQYFKPRFNCRISPGLTIGSLTDFLEYVEQTNQTTLDPILDFDVWLPTYGRTLQRDFCWTPIQKSNLIISILKGVYIPPLTVVQVRDRKAEHPLVWQIIDGKQRLNAALGFLKGEFPIIIEETPYYFNDLPDELQRKIKFFSFTANMVYCNIYYGVDEATKKREFVTDKDKVELYLYINYSGTQQEQDFMDDLNKLIH